MYKLNKISPFILTQHFLYFKDSIFNCADKYVNILDQADRNFESIYVCPLCLKNYIIRRKGYIGLTSDFNLDHFPPSSVGGKRTIITCKNCNNTAGTKFEAELGVKMKYEASRSGWPNALIKAKLELSDEKINLTSYLRKDENGITNLDFPIEAKNYNPFLKNWLNHIYKTNFWEIKLIIQKPDDNKILKAILKTAYLICFVNWGYDFAYSENAKLIRKVLYEDGEYPLSFISFWLNQKDLVDETKLPLGLCRIENPVEFKMFAVNVPLVYTNYSSYTSIMIPFAGEKGWNKLKEINKLSGNKLTYEITFKKEEVSLTKGIYDGYSKTKGFLSESV